MYSAYTKILRVGTWLVCANKSMWSQREKINMYRNLLCSHSCICCFFDSLLQSYGEYDLHFTVKNPKPKILCKIICHRSPLERENSIPQIYELKILTFVNGWKNIILSEVSESQTTKGRIFSLINGC